MDGSNTTSVHATPDPAFTALAVRHRWIRDPDKYAELEPGWAGLLDEAFGRIGALMATFPEATITGLQVKEKLGTLRLYMSTRLPPEIESDVNVILRDAEHRSETTCQVCGRPGHLRVDRRGWWSTTCDGHAADRAW